MNSPSSVHPGTSQTNKTQFSSQEAYTLKNSILYLRVISMSYCCKSWQLFEPNVHCFILWLKLIFCLYIEPIRKTYPNPKFVFLSVSGHVYLRPKVHARLVKNYNHRGGGRWSYMYTGSLTNMWGMTWGMTITDLGAEEIKRNKI